MKRLAVRLLFAASVAFFAAAPAMAGAPRPANTPQSTPELDPRGAGAAIVLLVGGALVLADRRRQTA